MTHNWRAVLAAVAVASLSFGAAAVQVEIGFSDTFRTGYYCPVRIFLSSELRQTATALCVSHRTGNPWHGEATNDVRVPLGSSAGQWIDTVVPIYDFAVPLEVRVLDDGERVLDSAQVELRAGARSEPLIVTVGEFPHPVEPGAVAVNTEALPRVWWGYEALGTLWIGRVREGLPHLAWEAISRWVVAGGTVIVFGGADLPLVDSPGLRRLLPLVSPQLERREDGGYAVSGELRAGADIPWTGADGLRLITHTVGLGRLYLVTYDAASCDRDTLQEIAALVRAAAVPSLLEPTAELLLTLPLQTPGHAVAVGVLAASLAVLAAALFVVRRQRRSVLVIVCGALMLSVLSGLHANRTKQDVTTYGLETNVRIISSVGSEIHCVGLYKTVSGMSSWTSPVVPRIERSPESLVARYFDSRWTLGEGGEVEVNAGEDEYLISYSAVAPAIDVRFDGEKGVQIRSDLEETLGEAYVVLDERLYAIPGGVRPGDWEVSLGEGDTLAQAWRSGGAWRTLRRRLGEDIVSRLASDRVWLVAVRWRTRVDLAPEERRKVSVADVTLVEGRGGTL